MKEMELCFTVTVDGKKYGPFPDEERKKWKGLVGKKGVEFTQFYDFPRQREVEKRTRIKRDRGTPLLDGISFVPIKKRQHNAT